MLTCEKTNCEDNNGNRNDKEHKTKQPPASLTLVYVHDLYSVEGSSKEQIKTGLLALYVMQFMFGDSTLYIHELHEEHLCLHVKS